MPVWPTEASAFGLQASSAAGDSDTQRACTKVKNSTPLSQSFSGREAYRWTTVKENGRG